MTGSYRYGMTESEEKTAVVIVGAGVAGLALGLILSREGIPCVILEKHERAYVEQRQRAGSLDASGIRILRDRGLGAAVEGHSHGAAETSFLMLVDGVERKWRMDPDDTDDGVFCPQHVLVRNLIEVFLREGGDLRFGARDVALEGVDTDHPIVRHHEASGAMRILGCDLVAGCDGYHGVSRTSFPAGALACAAHEFGHAWLTIMAEVPASPLAVLAIHARGFAAQITRGPTTSRLYLQCPVDDRLEQWPDERIWSEVSARFGRAVAGGPITSKQIIPLRGVVFSPMRYGRLHLLGDAAHLISPMSAEGMSLALHDADVLARAIVLRATSGDTSLLDRYSDTCLEHTWQRQAAAVRITETMHDAGDPSRGGEFRRQIARRNLEEMLEPRAEGGGSASRVVRLG